MQTSLRTALLEALLEEKQEHTALEETGDDATLEEEEYDLCALSDGHERRAL